MCDGGGGGGGAGVRMIVMKGGGGGKWVWGGIRFALQSDSDLAVKFKELFFLMALLFRIVG